jgi:hypothetical protein
MTHTVPDGDRRPSHDYLMAAQEALGEARQIEQDAGNEAMARFLNQMVLAVFRLAIQSDIDAELTAAYAAPDATEAGR